MSGGHFNYLQSNMRQEADEINRLIETNFDVWFDEYGSPLGRHYAPGTIARFREAEATLRRAAAMLQRVDWLVSGDDGEDDFHRRWSEEIES